jgi:replicative DNA helicase
MATKPNGNGNSDLLDKRLLVEHTLIGCAAIAPDDMRQSCGWLSAESFHDERAGLIWKRFLDGDDPMTFVMEFGHPTADALYGWLPQVWNAYSQGPELARLVAKFAHLDANRNDMTLLAKAIHDGNYDDATALIHKMADRTPSDSVEVRSAVEVGEAFLQTLDGDDHSIDTRMVGLDKATGGIERQNLTIIAAPPSTGKSAIALQIARNVAASGKLVLFASLEMPETDLWARMTCGDAGVSWVEVRRRTATREQLALIADTTLQLMERYDRRLLIHDQPSTTAELWQMVAAKRPDVLLVDHIRFCRDTDERGEHKRLGVVTQRLRDIGKQFDCAVIALAQLNREHNSRQDARPQLSDLRDSGEIEENADNVWMLYVESDGKNKPVDQRAVSMELWVRKARNGQRDVLVNLVYNRVRQWIRSQADPEEA